MTIDSFSGKYHFLSNFYPCTIVYEGITYPSTEHAYQAAKTLETETRGYIATLKTPGLAKKAGRLVNMRQDWESAKYKVMYEVCSIKFQDSELRKKLVDTAPCDLIEWNTWHDNTWGICRCKKCPGKGQNLLGRVLMEIRGDIKLCNFLRNSMNDEFLGPWSHIKLF